MSAYMPPFLSQLAFSTAPHFVATGNTSLAQKLLHLLARLDPKAQNVYIYAHDNVLRQKSHESESSSGAKQRAPHGGEHMGAYSLEDTKYAVCCAQGKEWRNYKQPLYNLGVVSGL